MSIKQKNSDTILYVEHNEISVPLGYDEGPAVVGKGAGALRLPFAWMIERWVL